MNQPLNTRVAIIGAGVSGLTAAMELKKRGFTQVTVFEKKDRVGGKTLSHVYRGTYFDIGSMMFSRSSEIAQLADQFKIPYQSFEAKDFYYSHGQYLSPIAYARRSYSLFDIARSLLGLRHAVRAHHLYDAGYKTIDPALFQPFTTYLASHRLTAAAQAFQPAITGLGYGYFESTPALYSLKIMASMLDPSLLKSLFTHGDEICFFPGGWLELWERVAATLDVRTGVTITSIERPEHQGVRICIDGTTETFDQLIVTTPLNHTHEYLDLSKQEQDLFRVICSHRMISTLVEGSTALKTAFLADNAVPERIGHVLGIECYRPETRCSVLFQTAPEGMTTQEICQTLKEDLRDMGCEVQRIVVQKEWEYFYHVSSESWRARL